MGQPCVGDVLEAIKSRIVRKEGQAPRMAREWIEAQSAQPPEGHVMVTLMGDPNMGKSSVLNSIFGKKVNSP